MRGGNLENVNQDVDKIAQGFNLLVEKIVDTNPPFSN